MTLDAKPAYPAERLCRVPATSHHPFAVSIGWDVRQRWVAVARHTHCSRIVAVADAREEECAHTEKEPLIGRRTGTDANARFLALRPDRS